MDIPAHPRLPLRGAGDQRLLPLGEGGRGRGRGLYGPGSEACRCKRLREDRTRTPEGGTEKRRQGRRILLGRMRSPTREGPEWRRQQSAARRGRSSMPKTPRLSGAWGVSGPSWSMRGLLRDLCSINAVIFIRIVSFCSELISIIYVYVVALFHDMTYPSTGSFYVRLSLVENHFSDVNASVGAI